MLVKLRIAWIFKGNFLKLIERSKKISRKKHKTEKMEKPRSFASMKLISKPICKGIIRTKAKLIKKIITSNFYTQLLILIKFI